MLLYNKNQEIWKYEHFYGRRFISNHLNCARFWFSKIVMKLVKKVSNAKNWEAKSLLLPTKIAFILSQVKIAMWYSIWQQHEYKKSPLRLLAVFKSK